MLGSQPDLEVVAEAADGAEALELCCRMEPELMLIDLRMPNMDGLEATRVIKGEFPRTVVLVLTAIENLEYLSEALRAGAGGYVLKYASPEEMIGQTEEEEEVVPLLSTASSKRSYEACIEAGAC